MTMHQGMDLSRFKKIASDGKTSTLRHVKGHEIKIAHSGLTPKMQEHLKGMPLHLAETGDVQGTGENDDSQLLTDVPVQQAPTEPEPLTTTDSQEAKPLVVEGIHPSSYIPTAQPEQPVDSPENDLAEHVKYAQDVASGRVGRKTYQDLFAKNEDGSDRGTLGRIGTLFGLMLSGAGSGLTHQPNMVMEMMNKELDRDLERQKSANSFLGTQYQHDLQQAQGLEHQVHAANERVKGAVGAAAAAKSLQSLGQPGAAKSIFSNYMDQNMSQMSPGELAKLKARAKSKMLVSTVDHLDKVTQNNPQANSIVKNVIAPKANELGTQGLVAAHALAQQENQNAAPTQTGSGSPVDLDKLNSAIYAGKLMKDQGQTPTPDMIDPSERDELDTETAGINAHRALVNSYDQGFRELAGMPGAGNTPGIAEGLTALGGGLGAVGSGGILAGALGAAGHGAGRVIEGFTQNKRNRIIDNLRDRLATFPGMSEDGKERLIQSMVPNVWDKPSEYASIYNRGMQHLKDIESKIAPKLTRYSKTIPGLKSDFPEMHFGAKKKK